MEKRLNLKVFRTSCGLNQSQMAKVCGCGLITYSSIENGKNDGKLKFWNALQNKFNLTGEQICELQQIQQIQEF